MAISIILPGLCDEYYFNGSAPRVGMRSLIDYLSLRIHPGLYGVFQDAIQATENGQIIDFLGDLLQDFQSFQAYQRRVIIH